MLKIKNFIFLNEFNDRDSVPFQDIFKEKNQLNSTNNSNKSSDSENSEINI